MLHWAHNLHLLWISLFLQGAHHMKVRKTRKPMERKRTYSLPRRAATALSAAVCLLGFGLGQAAQQSLDASRAQVRHPQAARSVVVARGVPGAIGTAIPLRMALPPQVAAVDQPSAQTTHAKGPKHDKPKHDQPKHNNPKHR